jgi:two-component system, NtrC family, sensor kinase
MADLPQPYNNKIRIPLFWKFTLGIFVVVALFGTINIVLIHRIIYSSLEEELQQRSLYISRTISERAIDQLFFEDIVGLNRLVTEMKSVDASVEYVFILNRNMEVKAHTFEEFFPADLLNVVSEMPEGNEISTIHIQPAGSNVIIRDITLPLLEGRAGYARVGLTEVHIGQAIDKAVSILIWMVVVFFIAGIAMTLVFSYMLTYPIKSISRIAEDIDLDTIQHKNVEFARRYPSAFEKPISYLPADELDILVEKFNEMVNRLQKAYGELEAAQKTLVHSEKMASIGSLAAGVAHEVNNPLAGMMHCIERIAKNPENCAEIVKYSALMQEATRKIDKVMKGLLSFARQPVQSFEITELQGMIKNSLLLASHKFGKQNISVSQDHQDPHVKIRVNKNRFEQVLLNLLLNSIDAIAEKQVGGKNFNGRINIRSFRNNDNLLVLIEDNGAGIPPDKINKITDPFFTTKAMGEGTGLGLSISMGIIKEHGGDMEINSIFNEGTTVKLTIPVKSI